MNVHIPLREGDAESGGVKAFLYQLLGVELVGPVVRRIDPGTHGEVDAVIAQFQHADGGCRILQYPLIALYEVSIGTSKLAMKRRQLREAASES